jgi:hypothetical protein
VLAPTGPGTEFFAPAHMQAIFSKKKQAATF